MLIPLYIPTIDGDDPCAWAPFGEPLLEVRKSTKNNIMKSDFSDQREFSVSILCRKHDTLDDNAISQSVGCIIDGNYLRPENQTRLQEQFHVFSKRLVALNRKIIDSIGFELYIIVINQPTEVQFSSAKDLKHRLALCGFREEFIRVDFVRDHGRLTDIAKLRLFNIANLRKAADLP
jgi:hypothetical protein